MEGNESSLYASECYALVFKIRLARFEMSSRFAFISKNNPVTLSSENASVIITALIQFGLSRVGS